MIDFSRNESTETEKEFCYKVMQKLGQYFDYRGQVKSKPKASTGYPYKIDHVIQCKKNPEVYFGIEFKKWDRKKGQDLGKHILQSMRYATTEFEVSPGFTRRIPILMCPPISYQYLMCPEKPFDQHHGKDYYCDRHPRHCEHHTVNGMLGELMLGEIRTVYGHRNEQKIIFTFSNWIVWTNLTDWKTEHTEIKGFTKNITIV